MHSNWLSSSNYCSSRHKLPFWKLLANKILEYPSLLESLYKVRKVQVEPGTPGERGYDGTSGSGGKSPLHSSHCKHHTWGIMYSLPCLLTHRLCIWKIKIKALNFKSVFPLLCLSFQFDLPMYLLEYFHSLYFGQVIFFHHLFRNTQYFNSC